MRYQSIVIYGYGRCGKAIADRIGCADIIKEETGGRREILMSSDCVIITLNNHRDYHSCNGYEMRLEEFPSNRPGIDCLIEEARDSEAEVIVVTNPADIFARYISEKLPDRRAEAFGLELDRMRFSSYLRRDVEVVGFHGNAVPLLGGSDIGEYRRVMQKVDRLSVQKFREAGINYDLVAETLINTMLSTGTKKAEMRLNEIEKTLYEETERRFEWDYRRMVSIPQILE